MSPRDQRYRVRRSDRARRARITVAADGETVVVLPRRAPLADAHRLVTTHADWLDRHLDRIAGQQARLATRRPLAAGRILLVAGEHVRISEVDVGSGRPARGTVEASPGQLIVRIGRDGRDTAALLDAWFRGRAREVIGAQVQRRATELSVHPGRISIRDQSSRWASASASGALSFSWRLLLTPPFVLDAVVVHELAHLRIRGHGRRFWALVERHAPRTAEARRWLHEHAYEVRAALD